MSRDVRQRPAALACPASQSHVLINFAPFVWDSGRKLDKADQVRCSVSGDHGASLTVEREDALVVQSDVALTGFRRLLGVAVRGKKSRRA